MTQKSDNPQAMRRCSFCTLAENEVNILVAGKSAFICGECINLCVSIAMQSNPHAANALFKSITDDIIDVIALKQNWHERYAATPPNLYDDEPIIDEATHD